MAGLGDFFSRRPTFTSEEDQKKLQKQMQEGINQMQLDALKPAGSDSMAVLGQTTDKTSDEIQTAEDAAEVAKAPEKEDKKELDKEALGKSLSDVFSRPVAKPAKLQAVDIGKDTDVMAARRKALMDMLR